MTTFVQFHLLTSYGPSNPNRDGASVLRVEGEDVRDRRPVLGRSGTSHHDVLDQQRGGKRDRRHADDPLRVVACLRGSCCL